MKSQTVKQLEQLLVRAIKAAAPPPEQCGSLLEALEGLELPAARKALGAAA